MARIDISFKNTDRDRKLYGYLIALEDRSYLIKEALRSYFAKELDITDSRSVNPQDKVKKQEVKENIDITDF